MILGLHWKLARQLFQMFFPTHGGDFTCLAGFFHWCGRFYMLAGRAGEIVSRRETPSQCGRVGSPALWVILTSRHLGVWLCCFLNLYFSIFFVMSVDLSNKHEMKCVTSPVAAYGHLIIFMWPGFCKKHYINVMFKGEVRTYSGFIPNGTPIPLANVKVWLSELFDREKDLTLCWDSRLYWRHQIVIPLMLSYFA